MGVEDQADQRQPQSGAAVAARGRSVQLVERLEDFADPLSRDADTGVGDFHQDRPSFQSGAHRHPSTVGGELDGVVEELMDDPAELLAIGQGGGKPLGGLQRQEDARLAGLLAGSVDRFGEQFRQDDRRQVEGQARARGRGELDQVIDQTAQAFGGPADDRQRVGLFVVEPPELAVGHQFDVALDMGQRGAQFVGDIRDQIGLELIEFAQPFQRAPQFGRALLDPLLELAVGGGQRRVQLQDLSIDGLVDRLAVDVSQLDQRLTQELARATRLGFVLARQRQAELILRDQVLLQQECAEFGDRHRRQRRDQGGRGGAAGIGPLRQERDQDQVEAAVGADTAVEREPLPAVWAVDRCKADGSGLTHSVA